MSPEVSPDQDGLQDTSRAGPRAAKNGRARPEGFGTSQGALLGVRIYEECLVAIVFVGLNRHDLSRDGVEKDQCVPEMSEVEHIGQRTC